jgi:hypothetical protein
MLNRQLHHQRPHQQPVFPHPLTIPHGSRIHIAPAWHMHASHPLGHTDSNQDDGLLCPPTGDLVRRGSPGTATASTSEPAKTASILLLLVAILLICNMARRHALAIDPTRPWPRLARKGRVVLHWRLLPIRRRGLWPAATIRSPYD